MGGLQESKWETSHGPWAGTEERGTAETRTSAAAARQRGPSRPKNASH